MTSPPVLPADRPLAVALDEDGLDRDLVGGKGASLARLVALGKPTPGGMILSVAVQERFIVAGGIEAAVAAAEARLPEPAARTDLERLMHDTALPADVADAIAVAATATGTQRLAVRSSAAQEDGQAASFAGVHESIMDVVPADCERAVRACWASTWTSSAVDYRSRRELRRHGGMAVLVQPYVDAVASAVVFTCDPLTSSADEITLNLGLGAGERLVSGTASAETIRYQRATLREIERSVPPRDGETVAGLIADDELLDLVVDCLEIEDEFGAAVDVEAVWDGTRWVLVQARPVTT